MFSYSIDMAGRGLLNSTQMIMMLVAHEAEAHPTLSTNKKPDSAQLSANFAASTKEASLNRSSQAEVHGA